MLDFYELCTSPVSKVLNKWFESDVLKATIATDTLIGTMSCCQTPANGYVLLHHMMGSVDGSGKGSWGYPEGGMGSVSNALASSAVASGVKIYTDSIVSEVLVDNGRANGVVTADGHIIKSNVAVVSSATPNVSYLQLLPQDVLTEEFTKSVKNIDYTSPVTKINVAVQELPNFVADQNSTRKPQGHHQCTIHLNCENMDMLDSAYHDAQQGIPSRRPMMEMVIPSSLDSTIAPPGCHVCLLFTQFTPYHLGQRKEAWDGQAKQQYANTVFDQVEEYAPGFKKSIVGHEVLTPPDLERIFSLTGGNIFHGAMSLDQLFMMRPTKLAGYKTPIPRYYLCGSGTHPGGGVMGAPGYNAASTIIRDLKKHVIRKTTS